MKRYYTRSLPAYMVSILKGSGFPPMMVSPTFADAFDWLASQEIYCEIHAFPIDSARYGRSTEYEAKVVDAREIYACQIIYDVKQHEYQPDYMDWNMAAEDTITKALEILNTEK